MKKYALIILVISLTSVYGCKKEKWTERRIDPVDFLSSDKYKSLVIQIVYEPGYELDNSTKQHLLDFLNSRLNKPGGIQIVTKEVEASGRAYISDADLIKIERKYRTEFSKQSTLGLFIFVSGSQSASNYGNTQYLGLRYGETGVALFGKTIADLSGGLNQPSKPKLEKTVVTHEMGHILGLVNNGTPMIESHEDAANAHHCSNKNCIMYYAVETSNIVSNLLNADVPDLDDDCIRDLQYNGGK